METNNSQAVAMVAPVLRKHKLGSARVVDEVGELRVYLDGQDGSDLEVLLASSDLESAAGKPASIARMSSLDPHQHAQVLRVGVVAS